MLLLHKYAEYKLSVGCFLTEFVCEQTCNYNWYYFFFFFNNQFFIVLYIMCLQLFKFNDIARKIKLPKNIEKELFKILIICAERILVQNR